MLTEIGPVEIDVPRDRDGTFEPTIVRKRQRRLHPGAALALGLQVICSVVAFGTVFLMPVFTESVQGHTALETGIALLPQGVVMGLGTYAGQRLSARVPLRSLVTGGFVVLTVASIFLLTLELSTPLWVVAAILSGRALAVGFVTTPLLIRACALGGDAPAHEGLP